MATIYEAWSLAELEAIASLTTILDSLNLNNIEVGDNEEKLNKVNSLLFSIGSDPSRNIVQSHQHQGGAAVWHCPATAIGIFETRALAMETATRIMSAVPITGTTHLVRLYLLDHPIVQTVEMQDVNSQRNIWGWQLKANFGAVYKCET